MNRAFLVIGAMKAGTTSLFNDLVQNPAIFMPEKEPSYLTRYTHAEAAAAYRKLFQAARSEQMPGDASTGYSMLPRYSGVAARAKDCLGSDLRIVYLVRNPIHRALSHHYHAFGYGEASPDPESALRSDPSFLAVSRYAMQLDPWREVFPPDQIRVIVAEEYYSARHETIREICRFLGVPEAGVDEATLHNRGEGRRIGRWNAIRRSAWYRRHVAPRLPSALRSRATGLLLDPGPPRPRAPGVDCLERMRDALLPDVEALRHFLGRSTAPWDLFDTVRRLSVLEMR